MSLTRSDAVIALGKRLVVCLKAEDDLLGRWMAHHLAVLIIAAETASPETRAAANAACAAAVLEIWRHRNTLPPHLRPLGDLEPILATLAALSVDPGSSRYHPETLRSAALAKAEGATKQWLEVSTPEEKCIGGPEQNYITDDGSQAPRTGRLAAGRSFVGRGFR